MHKKQPVLDALLQQRLLPLFYHDDVKTSINILRSLYDAGIRLLEYTNRGPNALVNFAAMKKEASLSMPGLQLGIGTIKNESQAARYLEAGADFIVCPTIEPAVGKITHEAGLLWIPGCLTPTEISKAEEAGAKLVKIFPGNLVGPSYITAIRDLFPGMLFMPTGGVDTTKENLKAWFDAGVVAVGMGSKLVSGKLVDKGDFDGIRDLTREAIVNIKSVFS
ncbi:MAG TPA: bifunctional 4-hydroxy-2-oxoglutarate aldolase/2-dehydro-3-deoxy-phosphogluconate aldolase [Chitinophagaceae bacterium]